MGNYFEKDLKEQEPKRIDWGIALDISQACARQAFRIRDEIVAHGVMLVAQLEAYPHITLFQGEFSSESAEAIQEKVAETLKDFLSHSHDGREIKMEGKLYFRKENNNIFWNVVKEQWLLNLHLALDKSLRTIPEWGIMKQFRARLEQGNLSEEERLQIEKYGVLSAGPLFLPHITIGKLAESADVEFVEALQVDPLHFPAENLTIGHIDQFGRMHSVVLQKNLRN